jgi:putative transposase
MLQDRLGISERRACRIGGQPRSTQRHEPQLAEDDQALRRELRQISRKRPRWGYRRAHQLLLERGWRVKPQASRWRFLRRWGTLTPSSRHSRWVPGGF